MRARGLGSLLIVVAGLAGIRSAGAAPFAYVTNSGGNSVSVVDTAMNAVVATVSVGQQPSSVAASRDGSRVYVLNSCGKDGGSCSPNPGVVSVIDSTSNTVVATVTVGTPPGGVAVMPDDTRAYVANGVEATVTVLDTATNSAVATVIVGSGPRGIALTPDGSRAYVANSGEGTVSVLDTSRNVVVATVAVGSFPTDVAIMRDGTRGYVTNNGDGSVSVFDTATNTVTKTITVGMRPEGLALTPDGTRCYVANNVGDSVSVVDTATNTVVATAAVGHNPSAVAVKPDGTRAYVVNACDTCGAGPGTVSVLDIATNTVVATVTVGAGPADISIGSGCFGKADGQPCSDGDPCTMGDVCSQGVCRAGTRVDCDDHNPCTADSCDLSSHCVHSPLNGAPCDDGDACTREDVCLAGVCTGTKPIVCSPLDQCHEAGTCDPTNGVCTNPAKVDGAGCDDGNPCTVPDQCRGGACVGGPPPACDDGNFCTDDACDPQKGCVHIPNHLPCEDGDACTTNDVCLGGTCVGGAPLNCTDSDPCTVDTCSSAVGCVHTPIPDCSTTTTTSVATTSTSSTPSSTTLVSSTSTTSSVTTATTGVTQTTAAVAVTTTTGVECASGGTADVVCLLRSALASPECTADRLPAALSRQVSSATRLVGKAAAATKPRRARSALAKAARRIRRAQALAAGTPKHPMSAACTQALTRALGDARARAQRLADTL